MNFNIQTMLFSDVLIPYQQKVYEVKPDLRLVESMKLASMMFFDELDFNLNINDDKELSQKTKDKIAVIFMERFFDQQIGSEVEQKFIFKLSSILHSKEDVYSRKFSISFKKLLDSNVDLKKEYEKVGTADKENNVKGDSNTKDNSSGESNGTSDTNSNTSSKSDDNNFNRQLDDNRPADRLGITANDGVGMVKIASSIKENKEINKNVSSGNGSQHSTDKNNFKGDNNSDSKFNTESVENKNDKTDYKDRLQGYDFRNKSQGLVYKEYLSSLTNVYEEIMDDCWKAFLTIL